MSENSWQLQRVTFFVFIIGKRKKKYTRGERNNRNLDSELVIMANSQSKLKILGYCHAAVSDDVCRRCVGRATFEIEAFILTELT